MFSRWLDQFIEERLKKMGTYVINRAANIAEGLGGGVATVIACSKPADSAGLYFGAWFRLYSDGFIEQGIITRDYWSAGTNDDNTAMQFIIPFKDTNYTVSITSIDASCAAAYRRKTKYSIMPDLLGDSAVNAGTELCVTARGFVSRETIDNILAGKVWATGPYDGTSPFHVWIDDPNA